MHETSHHDRPLPIGQATHDFFRFAVAGASDSIIVTTACLERPEPIILYVNAAFERMTGYNAQEVLGKSPRILQGPGTDRTVIDRLKSDLMAGRDFHGATANYRKDGTEYQVEWRVSGVYDGDRLMNWVAIQRDVTETWRVEREAEEARRLLSETNARLEALAATDYLTGLLNARAFYERLGQACSEARRHGRPLALALLDVDRFKSYNDAFGHPAGDEALKTVAENLRGETRDYDIAARHGGEEFALLLPNANAGVAGSIAERVRRSIAVQKWPLRPITVSVGVAELPQHACTPEELVQAADRALYDAKSAGRDRVSMAAHGA